MEILLHTGCRLIAPDPDHGGVGGPAPPLRIVVRPARLTIGLPIPGAAEVPLPMPVVRRSPRVRRRYPGQLGLTQGQLRRLPVPAPRLGRPTTPLDRSGRHAVQLLEHQEHTRDLFPARIGEQRAAPPRPHDDDTASLEPLAAALESWLCNESSSPPRPRKVVVAGILRLLNAHGGPLPARLALAMLALTVLREDHPDQFAACRALLAELIDEVGPPQEVEARAAIFLLMDECDEALPALAQRLQQHDKAAYARLAQRTFALEWWRPELDLLSLKHAFAPALPGVLMRLFTLLKLQGSACPSTVRATCLRALLVAVGRHQSREDQPAMWNRFFRKWMKLADALAPADGLGLLAAVPAQLQQLESWRACSLYQQLFKSLLAADAWLPLGERSTRALHVGYQRNFAMQALLHLESLAERGGPDAAAVPDTARLLHEWVELSAPAWSEETQGRLAKLLPPEQDMQVDEMLAKLESMTGEVEQLQQAPCSIS